MARSRSAPAPLRAPDLPRRLAEGVPPVVVFAGAERWFREDGLRQVTERVLPGGDPGAALVVLDAKRAEHRSDVSGAIDELRSTSLFGGGKVVAIRNPEAAAGPWAKGRKSPIRNLAEAALAAPVAGSVLVLLTAKPVKGSSPIPTKALVQAGALVVDCRSLYDAPASWERGSAPWEHELGRYVAARMKAVHGRRLDLPEAHALTRLVGSDLGELDAALSTLALYVGDRHEVKAEDVDAALGATRSDPAWKLTEAVASRDLEAVLDLVTSAFERGVPDSRGGQITSPPALANYLLSALHSTWRRLLAGAEGLARGESPSDVARSLGIPSFRQDAFLEQCRRDPADLLARHEAFLEAEMGLKGGLGVPPRLTIERLVVRLAGPAAT